MDGSNDSQSGKETPRQDLKSRVQEAMREAVLQALFPDTYPREPLKIRPVSS